MDNRKGLLLLLDKVGRQGEGEGEGAAAAAAAHAPRLHLVDGLAVIRRTGGVDPIQHPAVSSPSRPARRLPPGPLDSTASDLAAWCSWVPRPVRKRLRRSSLKSFDFMLLLLIPTRIHPPLILLIWICRLQAAVVLLDDLRELTG